MKNNFVILLFIIALQSVLTGCFQTGSNSSNTQTTSSTTSTASLIPDGAFAGAKTAMNKITGIQISWDAASVSVASYRVYRLTGTKMTLLTTLAPDVTGFIDGTANWGTIYSYIVRAVDKNNNEDTNTAKVTALSWAGISSVSAASRNSITVNFASATAVADEVRIYIQPAVGGSKTLAATVTGSDVTTTITGLRTGYAYIVSAQAYVGSLKKEDGNDATFKVSTNTLGYHDEDSSGSKWLNVINIRAFGPSAGAPVHPITPDKTPTTAIVEISFNAFSGMDSSTQYVVTRASVGYPLDTSVGTLCSATTMSACRVKCTASGAVVSGTGVVNCRDLTVGLSPIKYRYTMSILYTLGSESWAEPVPSESLDNFSVLVPIPPSNMVLIQRDAVNYEMCGQMSANVDAKNHNRCPYTGIGATPYNSGPGKPPLTFDSGYYDFGYNLFEDRFPLGCKWTQASDGGMCGAGATSGDCVGYSGSYTAPANTIGKNGDVFLNLVPNENKCFYKYNNQWYESNNILSVADYTSVLKTMYTSDPAANNKKIPVQHEWGSQYLASLKCASQSDSVYGSKRLPRMREFRAFNTFSTNLNELYGMNYNTAGTIFNGGAWDATNGYRCTQNVWTNNFTFPTSISAMLSASNESMTVFDGTNANGRSFALGAVANVDCQSRYGAQHVNLWNNWWGYWTSDTFSWNSNTKVMTGAISILDSGNKDLQQDVNGGNTGYVLNYTTATQNNTYNYYFNLWSSGSTAVTYISIPMGLPVLLPSSTVYLSRLSFVQDWGGQDFFPYTTGSYYTDRAAVIYGRWGTDFTMQSLSGYNVESFRCVMSAE